MPAEFEQIKRVEAIRSIVRNSLEVKQRLLSDKELIKTIIEVADKMTEVYRKGGKVLFCGNGGSAADAQHLSAELSGKFYLNRPPLNAEALHVNTSYLTATANDYSFEQVYSRLVEAKGRPGDMLIALSTSGNSANVVRAVEKAVETHMITVALTGADGGMLKDSVDYPICIPSIDTPRIQETHILIGHLICEMVEKSLFAS